MKDERIREVPHMIKISDAWRLDHSTAPHPCRDHTGREFVSESAMCRAWGLSRTTYRYRLARGMSPEEALTASPCDRRSNLKPRRKKNEIRLKN